MDPLDDLVSAVRASAKYRRVCEDFVRSLGAQELARRGNLKEAVKSTKNKLHQVAGAYLEGPAHYAEWMQQLRSAAPGGMAALRPVCARVMRHHASTRERLPILDAFYAQTLAGLGPLHSVLDVACGLNPLAIPWMPLAPGAAYYAYDIYEDLMAFLGEFVSMCHLQGEAKACSVLSGSPLARRVQLALLLKAVSCLEQVDKTAGMNLLEQIDAEHVLISFPVHSLGGRSKGMLANYEARFMALIASRNWRWQRFEFGTELAFLVTKQV
jgi:16S rRNA (guanine(1405)-N(7))-methyltransferase